MRQNYRLKSKLFEVLDNTKGSIAERQESIDVLFTTNSIASSILGDWCDSPESLLCQSRHYYLRYR